MDWAKLIANARTAWRRRASASDFFRFMLWTYSRGPAARLAPAEWTIGMCYPAPVGTVRLCLRANAGADAFIHSEVFELQCYRLPLRTAPATILDLGANIGLSAIYFARAYRGSRLACVEPVPDNVRLLRRNLALNGVVAAVIAAAADTKDGVVLMERHAADYGHRLAEPTSPASALFEVAGVSVPSIMRRLGWDRINLLKVDVEGHEKLLFTRDCDWLRDVDALCVEYHHHGAESVLAHVANRYGFCAPELLAGHLWFLAR